MSETEMKQEVELEEIRHLIWWIRRWVFKCIGLLGIGG